MYVLFFFKPFVSLSVLMINSKFTNMKRLKFLLIPILAMFFTGCEKEYITQEIYYGADMKAFYIDVLTTHWEDSDIFGYVYATFDAPEITKSVIDNGVVLAYYIDKDGRDNILPYVYPGDDEGELYLENIRYDVEQGKITFIIQDSDFLYNRPKVTMKFKVVVIRQ